MSDIALPKPGRITEPRIVPPKSRLSWNKVPSLDPSETTDEECREYIARIINHRSQLRGWAVAQAALNDRFYLADQWREGTKRSHHDGLNYRFELDDRYPSYFRSTTPRISRAADNEIGRISLNEFVPNPGPKRGGIPNETAARAAKQYLLHHLMRTHWDGDKREEAISSFVLHATIGMLSRYHEIHLEDPEIISDASMCPSCEAKFGGTRIPQELVSQFKHNTEYVRDVPPPSDDSMAMVDFDHCPMCESVDPLKPYAATREDLANTDPFGMPLGLFAPGQSGADLEIYSIFEMHPENGGLGVQPNTMRVIGLEKPRSLQWLAERYCYDLDLDALYTEEPKTLFGTDPFLGGEFYNHYSSAGDVGVFDNHALERIVIVQPQWGCPKGLILTQVNEQVIRKPLLHSFQGPNGEVQEVELMRFSAARYKRIPGLFWGRTPFSDAIGPQRRLNRIDTMQIWLREHGQAQFYLPGEASISNVPNDEDEEGLALRQFRVKGVPTGWKVDDALFNGGQGLTGNAYEQERRNAIQDIEYIFAFSPVEQGITTPHDPKTTTGLALMRDEAAKSRGPAETAFSQMCGQVFGHQLELVQAFHTDEDVYAAKTAGGRRELRSFQAAEIQGQVDVEIEIEGRDQSEAELRDGTAFAIEHNLYDLTDPDANEQALKNMGLPRNVNEKRGIQMRLADQATADFLREWKLLSIDPKLHDPRIWFSVLGKWWLDDDAQEIQKAALWDALLPKLAGWEQQLAMLEQQWAPYQGIPPEMWPQKHAELVGQYEQAQAEILKAQNATAKVGGAPPGAIPDPSSIPPPPAPPQMGRIPMALEERIEFALLQMSGLPPGLPDPNTPALVPEAKQAALLGKLIQFYARILAFGRMREMAVMPAPGGVGEVAQPGPQGVAA